LRYAVEPYFISIAMSESREMTLLERQTKIDNILNKTALDIAVFSVVGWTVGIGAGIFFHQTAPIRGLLAGVGGSYGFMANKRTLKPYL
jgi:uncharacterized membrane protein YeiH